MISPIFLLFLFVLGVIVGATINAIVDRVGLVARTRSPWSRLFFRNNELDEKWPRHGLDFLPLIGWISMARWSKTLEKLPPLQRPSGLESPLFWVRPLIVELFFGLFFVVWYACCVSGQLLPTGVEPELNATMIQRYWVHLVFFSLLLAATLIDWDDMIIPDCITVPGTLAALCIATLWPQLQLPATQFRFDYVYQPQQHAIDAASQFQIVVTPESKTMPLHVASPNPAPVLTFSYSTLGLLCGLWSFWIFAMLDRVWYGRRLRFKQTLAIFLRDLFRSPRTKYWIAVWLFLPVLTMSLFRTQNWWSTPHALGLLSALMGLGIGMLLVWCVRFVASHALGREAMGFGDVTLFGMIGAFLGWQACLPIFFVAPFLGLLHGLVNIVLGRKKEFPYGPWLCLATVLVMLGWPYFWEQLAPFYELGWMLGAVMLVCLAMMGLMLFVWARIRAKIAL